MSHAVNATNLHVGGGVQVAVSFLHELAAHPEQARHISVFASTKVDVELKSIGCDVRHFKRYAVMDVRGAWQGARALHQELDRFGTVFTVFGPLYRWRPPFTSIVGFAQPWIIYPDNECMDQLQTRARWQQKAKLWLQKQYFRQSDELIVELEHVREGVIRELGVDKVNVHVVHNCISSVYHDPSAWQEVKVPSASGDIKLGFLGRNYLHKNTRIFPAIARILRQKHGIDAKFLVTFDDLEWEACGPEFKSSCVNCGPLRVSQCPAFYQALDGVVFPSLLECASATPLEAMAMEKPLFASDRPFNRDLCGNHAHYFDPMSPESAAAAIANVFAAGGPNRSALRAARKHALAFSTPGDRAQQYLKLLTQTTAHPHLRR